ncbi:MAG: HAD-IIA family hydrolase, partial [Candidatus Izemoplasmatales bacterium]
KRLFLLDMDGTIYLDHILMDGALTLLQEINNHHGKAIYITNNSSRSVEDYVKKLTSIGISASCDDFFTSSMGMALYLKKHHFGKKVYCMGTKSLIKELLASGIDVTTDSEAGIEVVVLGYDTELTYQKLCDVTRLLRNDLPYLATNPDYVCPVHYGFVPDCGAMAEMLKHSTGKMPHFIGKPDPFIILEAISRSGFLPTDAVVVGDRMYTDIQSGINAKVTTIAVLSGESRLEDIITGSIQPDYVISSIKILAELFHNNPM